MIVYKDKKRENKTDIDTNSSFSIVYRCFQLVRAEDCVVFGFRPLANIRGPENGGKGLLDGFASFRLFHQMVKLVVIIQLIFEVELNRENNAKCK